MADEAEKLKQAGDDVGGIRKTVDGNLCYPHDTLGGADSGPAFEDFSEAWVAETRTLQAALYELAGKVSLSEQNYHGAEVFSSDGVKAAADGGPDAIVGGPYHPSEVVFDPGTPPVSTQPAPAGPTPGLPDFD